MPRSVRIAAIVQLTEAAGVLAAALIAGVDAIAGKSYQRTSGIAITLIGIATELGISQMHVSRLLARTLAQLRDGLTGED